MKFKHTASAVFCAASLLGCSGAPTMAVPTGEWEDFKGSQPQTVAFLPTAYNQGPATTVAKPTEVAVFTPPKTPGITVVKPAEPAVKVVAPAAPVVKPGASPPTTKPALEPTKSPSVGSVSPTVVPPKVFPASPVPPVVVVKAAAKPVQDPWVVSPGDATLRRALLKWAARAGWQLVWEASVDVPLNVNASFDGDFRSAVKKLFSSLSTADVNLTGLMYSGNHVLRVTETGRRAQ